MPGHPCDTAGDMTSSQIILVSVTSALIAVFAMLLVASLKRARSEEGDDEGPPEQNKPEEE